MIYEVEYEDISHTQKWSGVDVIAHELAHQFFGDTVTCAWWDTIWCGCFIRMTIPQNL